MNKTIKLGSSTSKKIGNVILSFAKVNQIQQDGASTVILLARNRFVGSLSGGDKWPAFSMATIFIISGPVGESDAKLEDSWTGLATVVLN